MILQRRKNRLSPVLLKAALPLVFLIMATAVSAQPKVKPGSFRKTEGDWKGSLTYLDYSSGKPYTMPVKLNISALSNPSGLWLLAVEFPDEPRANSKDSLSISRDGSQFNGAQVISVNRKNGVHTIVTEMPGRDGNENRKAMFRFTYEISRRSLVWRKEVRFEGETQYFQRNEYRFTR